MGTNAGTGTGTGGRRAKPGPGRKARAWAKVLGRRPRPRPGADERPSVREVCLLGLLGTPAAISDAVDSGPGGTGAWRAGERVAWSGRVYRVEAAEARPRGAGAGYVHLAPVAGAAAAV